MRIVHIEAYYPAQLGYHLSYIPRYQQRKGHDVFVITSDRLWPATRDYGSTLGPILGSRQVPHGRYVENQVVTHRLRSYEYRVMCYLRGLREVLEEIRPEVLHVHHVFWNPAAIQTALWKSHLKYGLIYDSHVADYNTRLHNTLLKEIASSAFRSWAVPLIKVQADFITAIGYAERQVLCRELRLQPEDVPVIPLGTDTELFRYSLGRRRAIRQLLSIGERELVILTSGKVTPDKDLTVLLNAFARLVASGVTARLIVVGSGSTTYLSQLDSVVRRSNLQRQVTFVGAVPHDELVSYYSAADVGVWTGGPTISIREAIACSLPVIIADNTSCGYAYSGGELVSKGNGLRFPRGDVDALFQQLVRLLSDNDLRERMRTIARRFAEEELSWDVIADRYLELYEKALTQGRRES